MATRVWIGKASKTAQVTTIQITAYDAATTYTLTINDKDVSVAGTTDADGTASALSTAWNASTEPEHAEITASVSTDTVTLTADTAGVPFTVTAGASGGTGTIGSPTTSTANKSPNDWNDADNWSGGAVPVNSDDVVIENADEDRSILYGLDQSSVTLTSLTIRSSFTGNLGLPEINEDSTDYVEYRDRYLAIGATTINIGQGVGAGSQRINIDTGSAQTTVNVYQTGRGPIDNVPALLWKGTHASNVININRGEMGICWLGGESATVATLNVGYIDNVNGDVTLYCGSGITLTTLNQDGGQVELNSGLTTIAKTGGILTVNGSASNVTTLTDDEGITRYYAAGTITTATVGSAATLDFSQDIRSKTITNAVQMHEGSAFLDPNGIVTLSGGFVLNRCRLAEVTIDVGVGRTIDVT